MDTPNTTYLAVPVSVMAAVSQILGSLPHDQVLEVTAAFRACMDDDHKVAWSPPQRGVDSQPLEQRSLPTPPATEEVKGR